MKRPFSCLQKQRYFCFKSEIISTQDIYWLEFTREFHTFKKVEWLILDFFILYKTSSVNLCKFILMKTKHVTVYMVSAAYDLIMYTHLH